MFIDIFETRHLKPIFEKSTARISHISIPTDPVGELPNLSHRLRSLVHPSFCSMSRPDTSPAGIVDTFWESPRTRFHITQLKRGYNSSPTHTAVVVM